MRVLVVQKSVWQVETISGDDDDLKTIIDDLVASVSEAQVSSVFIHIKVARNWPSVSHPQLIGLVAALNRRGDENRGPLEQSLRDGLTLSRNVEPVFGLRDADERTCAVNLGRGDFHHTRGLGSRSSLASTLNSVVVLIDL